METSQVTGSLLVEAFRQGTAELESHADAINALNVFPVPDGDTGTNMLLTLRAALEQLRDADARTLTAGEAAKAVARGVLLGARGNSGVILSQFVRGFAEGAAGKHGLDPKQLADALEQGTTFAYRAVIRPVEGTMLTVGKGASVAARAAADSGADLSGVLRAAAEGAARELERTPDLLPVLKRAGVVDAGGQGLLCFLRGAARACAASGRAGTDGSAEESRTKTPPPAAAAVASDALAHLHRNLDPQEIEHRYCTEFLIKGTDLSVDVIRARLLDLGDSLLVVGDDELVKVHIHTEHPGRALEVGVAWGDLLDVSIDNMREQQRQVASSMADPSAAAIRSDNGQTAAVERAEVSRGEGGRPETHGTDGGAPSPFPLGPDAEVGVVAVAPGDGWEELLRSLGVQQVVRGGQTMNPSAAELLEAIDAVAAAAVVVLPNNGNVVFAARQAQQLSKRRVHVVETTSPSAGVAAMLAFNPLADASEAAAAMGAAARKIRTAEITRAVRDSDGWGAGIKAGDRLGVVEGDIKVVAPSEEQAVLKTLEHMLDERTSFISIYYGDGVEESAAERTAEAVRGAWPRCEVEVVRGGQPVYSYLLSAE